jgi:hypothetical protein
MEWRIEEEPPHGEVRKRSHAGRPARAACGHLRRRPRRRAKLRPPRSARLGSRSRVWMTAGASRMRTGPRVLMVVGVDPGAARQERIVAGDVLVSVGSRTMREPSDLGHAERTLSPDQAVSIVLARDGGRMIKVFEIAPVGAAPPLAEAPRPHPPHRPSLLSLGACPIGRGRGDGSDHRTPRRRRRRSRRLRIIGHAASPPAVVAAPANTSDTASPPAAVATPSARGRHRFAACSVRHVGRGSRSRGGCEGRFRRRVGHGHRHRGVPARPEVDVGPCRARRSGCGRGGARGSGRGRV